MVERKSRHSPITKVKFHEINRSIKAGLQGNAYSAAHLAEMHGTSAETVRAVRRAGTWPRYEQGKRDRRARQVERQKLYRIDDGGMHGASGLKILKAAKANEPETKTLTIAEYDDLMKLKKEVNRLKEWKYNMMNPEVHTPFGLSIPNTPVEPSPRPKEPEADEPDPIAPKKRLGLFGRRGVRRIDD